MLLFCNNKPELWCAVLRDGIDMRFAADAPWSLLGKITLLLWCDAEEGTPKVALGFRSVAILAAHEEGINLSPDFRPWVTALGMQGSWKEGLTSAEQVEATRVKGSMDSTTGMASSDMQVPGTKNRLCLEERAFAVWIDRSQFWHSRALSSKQKKNASFSCNTANTQKNLQNRNLKAFRSLNMSSRQAELF
jgi:hypothetical protein